MVKNSLLLICLVLSFIGNAQIVGFTKLDTLKPFVFFEKSEPRFAVFGFESAGLIINSRDPITWNKNYVRHIRVEPHLSFYTKNNIGFGGRARIDFFQSNILDDRPTLFEFGIFARYYFPIQLNIKIFNRLSLSAEFSYSVANYYLLENKIDTEFQSKFNQQVIRIPIGLNVKIYKGLNLKWGYRFEYFLGQTINFENMVGLSYNFVKK